MPTMYSTKSNLDVTTDYTQTQEHFMQLITTHKDYDVNNLRVYAQCLLISDRMTIWKLQQLNINLAVNFVEGS